MIFQIQSCSRRGISLAAVIGTLMVVAIFAGSMMFVASNTTQKARKIAARQGAMTLARAARSYALGKIYDGLSIPDSEIFKTLIDKNLATYTPIPMNPAELNELAAEYRAGSVDLSVTVSSLKPLDSSVLTETTGGSDEVERRVSIGIKTSANVDGVSYGFTEIRELKVFNLAPGILGKFSLFVSQVPSDSLAYNIYASDINGGSDDRVNPSDERIPLIMKNGGDLDEGALSADDPDGWKRRGYIFLGGGKTVLNLTAGNDEAFGENFHFFKAGAPANIPGYYDPSPPGFFANPPDFSKKYPQVGNFVPPCADEFCFWIKHIVSGYFTQDPATISDMNAEGRLALDFPVPSVPGSPNPRMKSSVLHLFGTRSNPSPTLILGDVRRRYADYSAVLVDATGDAVRDAILTYLKQTPGPTMYGTPVPTNPLHALSGGGLPVGASITADVTMWNCQNMFADDYVMYSEKMCHIFEESYLRGHDYLYYRTGSTFSPQQSAFPGPDGLARTQQTFSLHLADSLARPGPFFNMGDLSALPMGYLKSKCVVSLDNFDDFTKRFIDEKHVLSLDTNAFVKSAPGDTAVIPPDLKVAKGGILVIENGDVKISRIDRIDPDAFLVVVALKGNILLSSPSSSKIDASLFAPSGTIVNGGPSVPIDLVGGLVVKTLDPEGFPAGGRLAFDTRTDPSGFDYALSYRGMVSGIADSFVEEQ